jgi:hypothetical protein
MVTRGSGGAIIGETIFECASMGNAFQNLLIKNRGVRKVQIYIVASWHRADSSF